MKHRPVDLPAIKRDTHQSAHPYISAGMGPDEMARAALSQARYHFHRVRQIMDDPLIRRWSDEGESRPRRSDLVVELQAHLRGFFWEVGAAFDCLLHWVNGAFTLGVEDTRTEFLSKLRKAAMEQGRGADQLTQLIEAFNSDWYFEVREYRNSSHKSILALEGLYSADGSSDAWWVLAAARRGQSTPGVLPVLARHGEAMENLVTRLVGLGQRAVKNSSPTGNP